MRQRVIAFEVLGLLGWATVVAAVALQVPAEGWRAVGVQVVAYLLIVLPALVRTPRSALPLGATPRVLLLGAALLIAAVCFFDRIVGADSLDQALRHAATAASAGIGEELLFRGALFARLRALLAGPALRGVANTAAFTLFHVPLVLVRHETVLALLPVVVLGALLTRVRSASNGLLLPTALHVAVDLSS